MEQTSLDLNEDDDERRLECGLILALIDDGDVGHNDSKEAVEAHAGSHDEGLVGEERHADRTDGRGNARREKHTVPQRRTCCKVRQKIRVERDDVGHGHKRGKTGKDLGADRRTVGLQLKKLFHDILPFFFPALSLHLNFFQETKQIFSHHYKGLAMKMQVFCLFLLYFLIS